VLLGLSLSGCVSLLLVPAQMALPVLAGHDISVFASQSAHGEVKGVLYGSRCTFWPRRA
jgi:hypothetical protein